MPTFLIDLMGSLILLIGIPFLLAFTFFLFPKVLRSISNFSSNKRGNAIGREELLRLLLLSELMESPTQYSGSGDKDVYRDKEQNENDEGGTNGQGKRT